MKTFARMHYEQVYDMLKPLLKMYDITSFDQILTADPRLFKSMYDSMSKTTINEYKGQVIANNVLEMNQYGASLKFYVPNDFVCKVTVQEALDIIRQSNLSNAVTISLDDAFITLFRTNVSFVYGNQEYVCKQIVYSTKYAMYSFLVPLNNSIRLFVTDYSSGCNKCREARCIKSNNKVKISFESHIQGNAPTVIEHKVYDAHRSECEIGFLMKKSIVLIGDALKQYTESTVRQKVQGTVSTTMTKDTAGSDKSTDNRSSEYFVKLNRNMMLDLNSVKHGTHASPVCHQVSGYWRKRSKNDSTMIYVNSFARGGSADEKKNLKLATGFTRQKVMKLTQEDE